MPEAPARTRFGRVRRTSAVSREVVMGIDNVERRVSLVAGAIALVLAAIISPHLFKNTWVTDTAKPSKSGGCPTGYRLVHAVCQHTYLTHPSTWLPQFLEILIVGLAILFFTWRRNRAGIAVASLLLGLALGVVGLTFLLLGGWLIIRALRLQRYGDASFSGSTRRAKEMSREKRAARASSPRAPRRDAKSSAKQPAVVAPSPSKRYTPKQRARRR
jgi:multisubunit Na+/H+ antiporter MnhB subunit